MPLSPAHQHLLDSVPLPEGADIRTGTVDYALDGTALEGFVAFDAALAGPRPGVLIVHDWTGVGDYTRVRCQMLARLGFVAMSADIYGRGVRPQGGEAMQVAGRYYADQPLLRARVQAGFAELLLQPGVDPERTAAIGYCFGGYVALELARAGAPVQAIVTFHARLGTSTPEEAALPVRLLICTGGADPAVPDTDVVAFERAMGAAPEADWQVVTYSGAAHAFTLPEADSPPNAFYQAAADRRSWAAMRAFFAEIFTAAP